jgi:tRNA pseudouridine38-40 synthase
LPTFRLTVAYDGTGYVGWQRQASGVSIQGLLEDAFSELDGRPVSVVGAGRTDAGVHALGQVVSVALERAIAPASLVRAINVRLPAAVRVVSAVDAPSEFQARSQARRKIYRYRIWNADVASPFERAYTWHIPTPALDVGAMADAARRIEGAHDFAAFQGAGSDAATTGRTVYSSRVLAAEAAPANGRLICYEVQGSGFLRYMVRNIVGSLVEVGRGSRPPGWMQEVLAGGSRERAGRTAPPEGLFLVGVEYE